MTRTRLSRTTTTAANGTRVTRTRVVPREVQEFEIQSEAVRQLRAHPDFGTKFTLAGDMAAGKRSIRASVIAKATGLVSGDPDLRLYLSPGRLCMIEYKAGKGRESTEQVDRIALLDTLGFTVVVVKADTPGEGAAQTMALVTGWLAECAAHSAPTAGFAPAGAATPANDNKQRPLGLAVDKAQLSAWGKK